MKVVINQPLKKGKILAFSLLEMTVVLAILGLLGGGILVGTSYIRSAQLTTVVNEAKLYLSAMTQFEQIYGGSIAGDMANATSYWSGTANGDGSGYINTNAESFQVYQHLALAGLIQGTYTGSAGPLGALDCIIGTNVPAMSVENVTGIFGSVSADGYISGNAAYYDGFYGSYLLTQGQDPTANGFPNLGFMTPQEAFELDNKFDNGIAGMGWMRTLKNRPNCVSGNDYDLTSAGPVNACMFQLTRN